MYSSGYDGWWLGIVLGDTGRRDQKVNSSSLNLIRMTHLLLSTVRKSYVLVDNCVFGGFFSWEKFALSSIRKYDVLVHRCCGCCTRLFWLSWRNLSYAKSVSHTYEITYVFVRLRWVVVGYCVR